MMTSLLTKSDKRQRLYEALANQGLWLARLKDDSRKKWSGESFTVWVTEEYTYRCAGNDAIAEIVEGQDSTIELDEEQEAEVRARFAAYKESRKQRTAPETA